MAASKHRGRTKQGTRPLVFRSGTRLDRRYTRIVRVGGRPVGHIDRVAHVYQFGGKLDHFFMRIYDSLMLGMHEWDIADLEAWSIEYIEEPGSGNCWLTSTELARERGGEILTKNGKRYGINKSAFDVYSPDGVLLVENAGLPTPRWAAELREARAALDLDWRDLVPDEHWESQRGQAAAQG